MRLATALAHPEWLTAVATATCCTLLLLAAARWHARRRLRLLLGRATGLAGRAADLLPAAALVAIGLALLGPRLGTRTVRIPASGVDVVVLVDVSRSMDATDVAPSRIDRARRVADGVLAGLGAGDRAALAAFADHGVVLTPLTADHAALRELLPAVDTDLMSDTGSRIWKGLAASLGAYDPAGLRPRELLVLTDGEGSGNTPRGVLDRLAAAQVRVVAVGIGSAAGGTIPTPIGALRDVFGEPVATRREMAGLERMARATGGVARAADRFGAVDPREILADLHRDAHPVADHTLERRLPVSRYGLPAGLALALLLLEGLLAGKPRRAATRPARAWPRAAHALPSLVLAACLVLVLGAAPDVPPPAGAVASLEKQVARRPEDVRALLALGVAQARSGDRQEARRSFLAALVRARRPEDAGLAYYDLGVAALEDQRLAEARDAFLDALATDPANREARFNLEWTLRALDRQPPPSRSAPHEAPPPRPLRPSEKPQASQHRGAAEKKAGEKKAGPGEPALSESAAGEVQPGGSPAGGSGAALRLDPRSAERWLRAVRDDASRAFQAAAQAAAPREPARRAGPRW